MQKNGSPRISQNEESQPQQYKQSITFQSLPVNDPVKAPTPKLRHHPSKSVAKRKKVLRLKDDFLLKQRSQVNPELYKKIFSSMKERFEFREMPEEQHFQLSSQSFNYKIYSNIQNGRLSIYNYYRSYGMIPASLTLADFLKQQKRQEKQEAQTGSKTPTSKKVDQIQIGQSAPEVVLWNQPREIQINQDKENLKARRIQREDTPPLCKTKKKQKISIESDEKEELKEERPSTFALQQVQAPLTTFIQQNLDDDVYYSALIQQQQQQQEHHLQQSHKKKRQSASYVYNDSLEQVVSSDDEEQVQGCQASNVHHQRSLFQKEELLSNKDEIVLSENDHACDSLDFDDDQIIYDEDEEDFPQKIEEKVHHYPQFQPLSEEKLDPYEEMVQKHYHMHQTLTKRDEAKQSQLFDKTQEKKRMNTQRMSQMSTCKKSYMMHQDTQLSTKATMQQSLIQCSKGDATIRKKCWKNKFFSVCCWVKKFFTCCFFFPNVSEGHQSHYRPMDCEDMENPKKRRSRTQGNLN